MVQDDGIVFLKTFNWNKKCKVCQETITVNSSGWWFRETKQYAHKDCYTKPQANPKSAKASGSGSQAVKPVGANANPNTKTIMKTDNVQNGEGGLESASSHSIEVIVAARLVKAKEIVNNQFPTANEFDGYLYLIQEVLHQLGSEEWLNLEKEKR